MYEGTSEYSLIHCCGPEKLNQSELCLFEAFSVEGISFELKAGPGARPNLLLRCVSLKSEMKQSNKHVPTGVNYESHYWRLGTNNNSNYSFLLFPLIFVNVAAFWSFLLQTLSQQKSQSKPLFWVEHSYEIPRNQPSWRYLDQCLSRLCLLQQLICCCSYGRYSFCLLAFVSSVERNKIRFILLSRLN